MTAYMSTEEILARQQRMAEADAKAGADVTEADLRDISPERLSDLMNSGQLAHLGIGAPRRPGRRH
jgi:hypothetical protein